MPPGLLVAIRRGDRLEWIDPPDRGDHFFLYDSSGSGPSLKFAGADVVAGQFDSWAPIGAEQTASGYEVAWKVTGADLYTVWATDSSGNYTSHITSNLSAVSGADYALQSLEPSFHQDLNHDEQIGVPTLASSQIFSSPSTQADVNGDGRDDIVGFAHSGVDVSQSHDFLLV